MPNGDLPFVDVSRESLAKLSNREVLQVHARFNKVSEVPEGLSREEFIERFVLVLAELKKREIDSPDMGSPDDVASRLAPKRETEGKALSEAFHLRDTHWVDIPESGACPVSHPTKARFPGKEKQVCFTRSAAAAAAQARMREQAPEKIAEDEVNLRPKDFPTMKCAACRYFVAGAEPGVACKIVTRAEPELVCDAYQGAERRATYQVADKDWPAFVRGMVKEQPYQHVVLRGFMTTEGPIVIIRDTMKPKPHVFSLSKKFHLEHTGSEHGWTQEEVDRLIEAGAQDEVSPFTESFRIDLTYKPDEEPTHEQLEANRAEILAKFAEFVKMEFPKGEIKVELENLIPQEAQDAPEAGTDGDEPDFQEAKRDLPPNVFTDLEGVRKFAAGSRGR